MASSPLLEVDQLAYSRPPAGDDRGFAMEVGHLSLRAGQAIGVVGPSGCGKSTLIDLLAMLRRPSRATQFAFMGQDIAQLWTRQGADGCAALRAEHIGVILQTGGLLPSLPLWHNVLLSQRLLGRPDREGAEALLQSLELGAYMHRLPAQLSIGQRQRAAIARALAHRPALVLADEPTAALGVEHAPAALDLLLKLTRERGAALIVVSHDLALLRSRDVALVHCRSIDGVTHIADNEKLAQIDAASATSAP